MKFSTFKLHENLLKAITELNYTIPTPIQIKAIPAIMQGKDVLGNAQTGTGKTASYLIPIIQIIVQARAYQEGRHPLRTLILTPTRELAIQVGEDVINLTKYLEVNSAIVYGGVGYESQIKSLSKKPDILVATSGRLLDLVAKGEVDISKVNRVVIDEADRMFDMGFIDEVKQIFSLIDTKRQTMLFSATFTKKVKEFTTTFLNKPSSFDIARVNKTNTNVKQFVHHVDCARKKELLSFMIGSRNYQQVLVFASTKESADEVVERLNADGLKSLVIHKDIKQGGRKRALESFKEGKIRVLVATDIAGRGLNIDNLPIVINYELPTVAEDYIHRIGRTGRGDNSGEAITLLCYDEIKLFNKIEAMLKVRVPKITIDGFEPTKAFREKILKKKAKDKAKFAKAKASARDNFLKESKDKGFRPRRGRQ